MVTSGCPVPQKPKLQFSKKTEFHKARTSTDGVEKKKHPWEGKKRGLQFAADTSGCSCHRLSWPAQALNYFNRAVVSQIHFGMGDPNFFRKLNAVVLQRQATEGQLKYCRWLKQLQSELSVKYGETFRMIYEIDDVILPVAAIPEYNACKEGFKDTTQDARVVELIRMCDEMHVPSEYMRRHYQKWTGKEEITTIPNYMCKQWIGHFYDHDHIMESYKSNTKRPRIGWAGSGTHFDIKNNSNQQDDFIHVGRAIVDTLDEFQWVLFGAYPVYLHKYVQSGQIEYHPWVPILQMPEKLASLDLQCMVAPLVLNEFSQSKSDIKLRESNALGLPCVCQRAAPYANARFKSDRGKDMVEQIRGILEDEGRYSDLVVESRDIADRDWLHKHVEDWHAVYFTDFGSEERRKCPDLLANNPEQFA